MSENLEHTIYSLLLELVSHPSVSPSAQRENEIARFIRDRLAEEPYFREQPADLRLWPCGHDPLGRHCLFALVRAEEPTPRTVILTGHMDVVDTEAYGPLAELAFDPERLTEKIGSLDLSSPARRDLESGDWLFGRGVSDMKGGIAVELAYLLEAARRREQLPVNVAVLLVPDEENNSQGMIDAVPYLRRMQEEGEAEFLACINTEPTVSQGDSAGPTVYTGSIGKINPFFFCLGRETHVGEYYQGLCAAPIVSQINLMLDGNPEYADRFNGISYPPYGCLRQLDLREEYSASIMVKAAAFYSYLTVSKLPGDILNEMRETGLQALEKSLERHEHFSAQFAELRGLEHSSRRWRPKVLSFGELREYAEAEAGVSADELAEQVSREAPSGFDEREKALRLVELLVERSDLRGPLVVLGFLPPFYPHRVNNGDSPAGCHLQEAVRQLSAEAERELEVSLERKDFFEGVSDLSYCGFGAGPAALEPLADNLPGWNRYYTFPVEDLSALDIPVLNLGPIGRDAHKLTERLYLPYALRTLPALLDRAVRIIGERPGGEDD